jgi:ParB family transcriptional regulator, chromosome partitioning protein
MSEITRNTGTPMAIPLQKGRLGRGLASLIGEPPQQSEVRLPVHGEQRVLPIAELHPSGFNPRRDFNEEELAELASSIRAKGLVQPIVARPDRQRGGYEIVAGERRWRAAQRARLHDVPVIVRELSDLEVAELAIIENVQRADLNPIEEACGYYELIDKHSYTQEQVSDVVGKSRSHLANMLRLLKLPEDVQALVRQGKLSAGAARAIVGQKHPDVLAEQIVARGLNVRQVETLIAGLDQGAGGGTQPALPESRIGPTLDLGPVAPTRDPARDPPRKDADTSAFEKDLSDALGLKVEVKRSSGESGYLTIQYGNYDQLDYIRKRLTGEYA